MITVSLDCTGAFDCVGFDAASEALIANGVSCGYIKLVHKPVKR